MKSYGYNARVTDKKHGARTKGFKVAGPTGGVAKPIVNKLNLLSYSK